jgi:hypothetical protein
MGSQIFLLHDIGTQMDLLCKNVVKEQSWGLLSKVLFSR